jgi:electron transport complex protein RnfE
LNWTTLKNKLGSIPLLGLCPLLAVSTTFVNAFTLGFATLFVLICSNGLISSLARLIPSHLRLPMFVLIIAGFVTLTQLFLSAYFFNLYESLGIFLALITTNCLIMGRAESFASKNVVIPAMIDGLKNGLGFMVILCLLGGIRELLGQHFLLAQLAPGAFILLGCILAWVRHCEGENPRHCEGENPRHCEGENPRHCEGENPRHCEGTPEAIQDNKS